MATVTVATDKKMARAKRMAGEYGMDLDEYETRLKGQRGACAICGTWEPGGQGWNVDHCHEEGGVRGLLCPSCNIGLGAFKDNPASLRRAADYVERYAERHPCPQIPEGAMIEVMLANGQTMNVPVTREMVRKWWPGRVVHFVEKKAA